MFVGAGFRAPVGDNSFAPYTPFPGQFGNIPTPAQIPREIELSESAPQTAAHFRGLHATLDHAVEAGHFSFDGRSPVVADALTGIAEHHLLNAEMVHLLRQVNPQVDATFAHYAAGRSIGEIIKQLATIGFDGVGGQHLAANFQRAFKNMLEAMPIPEQHSKFDIRPLVIRRLVHKLETVGPQRLPLQAAIVQAHVKILDAMLSVISETARSQYKMARAGDEYHDQTVLRVNDAEAYLRALHNRVQMIEAQPIGEMKPGGALDAHLTSLTSRVSLMETQLGELQNTTAKIARDSHPSGLTQRFREKFLPQESRLTRQEELVGSLQAKLTMLSMQVDRLNKAVTPAPSSTVSA